MLTTFESLCLVFGCIVATVAFLFLLQLFWPCAQRRNHNDIIGWHVSVLGTTYAVIIGFMLYAVWTSYQDAEINADNEANSIINLYRLADGLPAPQRLQLHQLLRDYTEEVIDQEWPAMTRGQISPAGRPLVQQLWANVMQVKPVTFGEQTSMNLTLTELTTMTQHRRVRELQSESGLPGILWAVLLTGGAITTLSCCLFGTDNFKLHCVQVISLTLLLSLALVTIAGIDRPFQGTVHVSPRGFERARLTIAETPQTP
jgi:hypothetical protein